VKNAALTHQVSAGSMLRAIASADSITVDLTSVIAKPEGRSCRKAAIADRLATIASPPNQLR
jgi:hypothetical protein